ncbi:16586_t:CDS:2, partial [Cetraspora pellucida]
MDKFEHLKKFNYEDFQNIQDLPNISDELIEIKYAYLKTSNSHVTIKILKYNENEYYNRLNGEIQNLKNILANENVIKFLGVTKGVILWEISSGKPAFDNNHGIDIDKLKGSLLNGKRELPINLTPVDYKDLYCDAWDMDHTKRLSINEVVDCLEEIDLDFVYHDYGCTPKISCRKNNSTTKEEACLKIIEGSPRNHYLFLPEGVIFVGRKDSNDIVIKDQEIKKKHAKINNYHGQVEITCFDFKSKIFINGTQLDFHTLYKLKNNDIIKMGNSTFQYLPAARELKKNIDSRLQIYNNYYLMKSLNEEFENNKSSRNKQKLSLLFCDLDHFGKVNKEHGHEAGDYVLIKFSELIQNEYVRNNVIFSRYGGEEFTILLININLKSACKIAKDIRTSIEEYQFSYKEDKQLSITLSIGVSGMNSSIKESKDILYHAEEACRMAKKYGRNRVVIWENEQVSIRIILGKDTTVVKKDNKKAYMLFLESAAGGNNEAQIKLQLEFQPLIPSQASPFPSDENEVLKIDTKWYSILGEKLPLIEPKHYFIFSELILQPKLLSHQIHANVAAVLPYIRQQVKMREVDILKAENFANLINDEEDESSDNESKDESKKLMNRLSRFDCLATLLASAESTVAQNIFQIISQFPIALPLLIPELDNSEKFKIMLPLYTGPAIKWCTSNGSIIENHLFEDSFKMIVAVRIGMNPQGKSTILNRLMASKYMFTSSSEPRAEYGIPHMINGSVEFVWLTEETCGADLWNNVFKNHYYYEGRNEIVLLANLHGDALYHKDQIEFLKQLASCFLVFLMPGHDENQRIKLESLIGLKKVRYIYVNPENNVDVRDNYIIDTKSLMSNEECEIFKDVLDLDSAEHGKFPINKLKMEGTLRLAETIKCDESQKIIKEIIKVIKDKTCRHIKLEIVQLQRKEFEDQSDFSKFSQFTKELKLFSSIIALPIRERINALAHLERELSRLSTLESSKPRNDAISKKKQLNNVNIVKNDKEKNQIREAIIKLWEEVDNTSLGIEHFFRGLGHMYNIYKIFISDPKVMIFDDGLTKENILKLPEYYAELLINGHTIELVDGDSAAISEAWFLAVCSYINRKFPNLRVYVISILGLQSSGKSTLLNALFASKFTVSEGRCTRGIFMQFLFLEKDLSDQLGVDAFILIDTEGLGALGKMGELETDKKDQIIATFVMRISHLIIINILGESMKEILQITIRTMANLNTSPNILIIQHVVENYKTKSIELEQKFQDIFQEVLENVKHIDGKMEACNFECLSKMKDKKLYKIFAPFKNDKICHKDIVDLYNSIINECKDSIIKVTFSEWFPLIKGYWDTALCEDSFILKFKETFDFIKLGKQIAKLKVMIDMAFLKHKESMEEKIRNIVQEQISKGSSVDSIKSECEELIKKLNNVPEIRIKVDCEECKKVAKERDEFEKRNYVMENETIEGYIIDCRESTSMELKKMLDSSLTRKKFFSHYEFIDKLLEMVVSTQKGIGNIWNSLRERVLAENKKFMNEEIDNKVYQEYRTTWTPDHFKNYIKRNIPELSNIDAICYPGWFSMKKRFGPDDIAWLKNEINRVIEQISSKTNKFDSEVVHKLKDETEKILDNLSTQLDVKFNSEFKINVHVYALLEMLGILEKWDKHNTLLGVLDKIEAEYKEKIEIRVKYDHLPTYKGHVTGDYLLKAIHKKAINAESRDRIDNVLSIPWIGSSETIRLKYFIELAEQIRNGDKVKAVLHFSSPKKRIEEWFQDKVNKYTKKEKGQKYKETFDKQLNDVYQEISKCKSYNDIRKFVNKYMAQIGDIDYQLNIKDNSINENFDMFYEAIVKELEDKCKDHCQLKEESLPNPSDDKLVKKRLGCTKHCYWCGALCWGERDHDKNSGETKSHHSSHQPGGLKGTQYKSTRKLVAISCHNRSDETKVYYSIDNDAKILEWGEAKSTDFKDWKFEPHYITNFNEIMCWFFENLHKDLAEKYHSKPADELELRNH